MVSSGHTAATAASAGLLARGPAPSAAGCCAGTVGGATCASGTESPGRPAGWSSGRRLRPADGTRSGTAVLVAKTPSACIRPPAARISDAGRDKNGGIVKGHTIEGEAGAFRGRGGEGRAETREVELSGRGIAACLVGVCKAARAAQTYLTAIAEHARTIAAAWFGPAAAGRPFRRVRRGNGSSLVMRPRDSARRSPGPGRGELCRGRVRRTRHGVGATGGGPRGAVVLFRASRFGAAGQRRRRLRADPCLQGHAGNHVHGSPRWLRGGTGRAGSCNVRCCAAREGVAAVHFAPTPSRQRLSGRSRGRGAARQRPIRRLRPVGTGGETKVRQ